MTCSPEAADAGRAKLIVKFPDELAFADTIVLSSKMSVTLSRAPNPLPRMLTRSAGAAFAGDTEIEAAILVAVNSVKTQRAISQYDRRLRMLPPK